jgi:hypothetical protein
MTQPIPPGWYPNPSGAPGTQYWDGRQWTGGQQLPRKRAVWPWILVGAAVMFFGGCGALVVIGAALGHHDSTRTSRPAVPAVPAMPSVSIPAAPTMPSITITTTTKPPPATIGQEVRDGDTVFVVTSVDQSKIAGDPGNPYMQVTAQGQFLNVHLMVRNAGNKPQTFFAANQKLKLGDSVFEANGAAALWTQAMNVTINPGNSVQVVVSFDVPANTVIKGVVQLHESLISPGAEVSLG